MFKYKRTDDIVNAMGNFIALQLFSKLLASIILITSFTFGAILYQKFAFDHIEVLAIDQQAFFDLKIKSDYEVFNMENLKTPYAIKVPKGENIEIEITNNSERICGSLKSGYSSLIINHSKTDLKLARTGEYLKGGCL